MWQGRLCIDQDQMSDKSPPPKPESEPLQSLQAENQRLRDLVVSLSATLLRKIALDPPIDHAPSSADVEHLLHEAEQCFRCAKFPGLKREIADGLEAAGHEFMGKAVEVETKLQREK
jgi:hypothetical protein